MNDGELFTRLLYFGTVQLHKTEREFWLTKMGKFLDLWECHKQFLGISKPKREVFIDEIM
jgi:hypothetical protein